MAAHLEPARDKKRDQRKQANQPDAPKKQAPSPEDMELAAQLMAGQANLATVTPGALQILHQQLGQDAVLELLKEGKGGGGGGGADGGAQAKEDAKAPKDKDQDSGPDPAADQKQVADEVAGAVHGAQDHGDDPTGKVDPAAMKDQAKEDKEAGGDADGDAGAGGGADAGASAGAGHAAQAGGGGGDAPAVQAAGMGAPAIAMAAAMAAGKVAKTKPKTRPNAPDVTDKPDAKKEQGDPAGDADKEAKKPKTDKDKPKEQAKGTADGGGADKDGDTGGGKTEPSKADPKKAAESKGDKAKEDKAKEDKADGDKDADKDKNANKKPADKGDKKPADKADKKDGDKKPADKADKKDGDKEPADKADKKDGDKKDGDKKDGDIGDPTKESDKEAEKALPKELKGGGKTPPGGGGPAAGGGGPGGPGPHEDKAPHAAAHKASGKHGAAHSSKAPAGASPASGGAGGASEHLAPAASAVAGMDEYKASHPDAAAQERVDNLASARGKSGRDLAALKGAAIDKPSPRWYDAITPRQEWGALQKKLASNPYKGKGGDKALAFMTDLNSILDFVGSAASKIGLAATIGGAILTILVPPVGAFLLTVGRVANAVSLVVSGLRFVSSIVMTIMLAVKAAKTKDPAARMQMLQQMKGEIQSGVAAGIDLILSKVGGKAKGVGKSAGGGVGGAMKAGWKAGGVKGAIKAGAKQVGKNVGALGTSIKTGIKNNVKMVKELGVGGTIKALAKKAGGGIKNAVKGSNLVKGVTDLKSSLKSFKGLKGQMGEFRGLIAKNGGGFKGYAKTIGQMNFPNMTSSAGWKQRLKGLKTDLFDKSGGGAGTRIAMGMEGGYDDPEPGKLPGSTPPRKNTEDKVKGYADKKKKAIADMEAALQGDDRKKKIEQVKGEGSENYGTLQKEAYDKHSNHYDDKGNLVKGDLGKRGAAYKVRAGTELSTEQLNHALQDKLKSEKKSLSFLSVQSPLKMGLDVAKSAKSGDVGNVGKTALSHVGGAGSTMAGFMVNSKTAAESKGPSLLKQAKASNDKRTNASVDSLISGFMTASSQGTTAAKVQLSLAPATAALSVQASDMMSAMTATGSTPDSDLGGGDAGPTPEPAPEGPPEGTEIPDIKLLEQIASERKQIKVMKDAVAKIKKDEQQKYDDALGGLSKAKQIKLGLTKQSEGLAKQKTEAAKDATETGQPKKKLASGGKQLKGAKDKASGEGDKANAKAAEGRSAKVKPDEAKKRKKEEEKARKDRAAWEKEYRNAGIVKKGYMKAKKWLFSFTKLLAKAAKWLWKKLIAPAIAAVKKAMAKVMGLITDLVMRGVMKVVKMFLSKEEGARLDETMAQMKELEAKQAKQAVVDTAAANKKEKVKLSKAEKQSKEKAETAKANVAQADAITGQLDEEDKAFQQEEVKVKAANADFDAKYAPYFAWAAKKDEAGQGKAPGGGAGAGAAALAGAAAGAAAATMEPSDKPLAPAVGQAIANACGIVATDSEAAEADVKKASADTKAKLYKKADGLYDQNAVEMKTAAAEALDADSKDPLMDTLLPQRQQSLDGVVAGYHQSEQKKVASAKGRADKVDKTVTGAYSKTEAARRGRVNALKGQAAGLNGMKGQDGAKLAKALMDKLSQEAGGIDKAKADALKDLQGGYINVAKSMRG